MIPIAAIMVIAAGVTIFTVARGNETNPRQTGPIDGTFAVDFGAATKPDGQPYENAPVGRETWVIESACRADGCVATASKVSGSLSTTSTLVLDQIDGRWKAVSATPGTCQNAPSEFWETISLQSRPDGTLQGEFIVRSTTGCARNQQVTFTRTGDVPRNASIADPEAQPLRVASPAQALHGRYQETDTYAEGRSATASFRHSDVLSSHWPALLQPLAESRRRQGFRLRTGPVGLDEHVSRHRVQNRRSCPPGIKPRIRTAPAAAGSDYSARWAWTLHSYRRLSLQRRLRLSGGAHRGLNPRDRATPGCRPVAGLP